MIALRQTYSRLGHNYLIMTVPQALAAAMAWVPGDELGYYPVRYKNGLEGVLLVKVQSMVEVSVDNYDDTKVEKVERFWRDKPKPGSVAAREVAVEDGMNELMAQAEKVYTVRKRQTLDEMLAEEKRLAAEGVPNFDEPNEDGRYDDDDEIDRMAALHGAKVIRPKRPRVRKR